LENKLAETTDKSGFFNNWKNGYIPPTSTMSSTTPDPYGGFLGGLGTKGQVTTDPTAIAIYNMDDAERKQIALLLKNAGIKVPTTGKYSEKLVDAYIAAAQAAALQSSRLGREFTVREYLTQEAAGIIGDTGAAGGPSIREDIQIWNPTKAAGTIQDVVSSMLNREATPEEVTLLAGKLKAAQEKAATRTQYVTKGGKLTAKVTGGLDEQQFLIETIQKNKKFKTELDELKARKTTAEASAAQGIRQDLTRTALANGLKLDEDQIVNFESRLKAGENIDAIKATIRKTAALGMPDSVKQIVDSGVDLSTIYSPYRSILAQTLEINPNSISLDDPTLRMAIGPDKEMSLYEYQRSLRKDNRWQYTDQARAEAADIAKTVLKDFGFMG
jgi:hypothetical protein